jgi:uridine kinase
MLAGGGRRVTRGSFIVGIAGGSASGKSTFAAALADRLTGGAAGQRVEVFGTDRYFRKEGGPTFVSPSSGESQFNANHPDSLDLPRLLIDLDARTNAADAPDVIVVEGLMVLHHESLRERLDLRLFMELDADERALRRMLRNMANGHDPRGIATYYRECARIGHARYVEPSRVHADLILRGDADFARTAPMVAALIDGVQRAEIDAVLSNDAL